MYSLASLAELLLNEAGQLHSFQPTIELHVQPLQRHFSARKAMIRSVEDNA